MNNTNNTNKSINKVIDYSKVKITVDLLLKNGFIKDENFPFRYKLEFDNGSRMEVFDYTHIPDGLRKAFVIEFWGDETNDDLYPNERPMITELKNMQQLVNICFAHSLKKHWIID